MKKKLFTSILLFAILLLAAILTGCGGPKEVRLTAYVGDGMKTPVEKVKEVYEKKNPHVTIEYSFAGSGTLEQTIRSLEQGDLYMPGSRKYINSLDGDQLVVSEHQVALHVPAIIVSQDATKVTAWEDLALKGVKLGIPNPELASSGKMANIIIDKSPQKEQIRANITVLAADVRETLDLLLTGKVDAVISWRSASGLAPDKLKVIDIPENLNEIQELNFAVLSYSKAQEEAEAFAKFAAGPEGKQIFRDTGFQTEK